MNLVNGIVVRYVLLAIVNALAVYTLVVLAGLEKWTELAVVLIATVVIDIVYATKRFIPMKYLMPGLVLLLVYQVYVVLYTGVLSFTNSSEFAQGTREESVSTILAQNERRVADSAQYRLTVLDKDGEIAFLVTDAEGNVLLGTEEEPLEEVTDAEVDDSGKAVGLDGYSALDLTAMAQRTDEIIGLRVPFSEDATEGSLKTQDGLNAFVYEPTAEYDESAGTITREGVVYAANEDIGYFESDDGDRLTPGWKVYVGFENYQQVVTNRDIRGPFLSVLLWTFTFAILSVATTFALGLFTAIVLNDDRMRFRRLYRSLLILPYAIPGVVSAGVFKGMLNTEFGWVNDVLLFGADVDWLGDAWLAKLAVLGVNLWLGYPYMFLVGTGALQAIPSDVVEAGKVDGASAWNIFRHIKLPYIMIATAPLLIASFAFNFNNFLLIYALTDGGPSMTGTDITVGHTDLLITLAYKLAFDGQQSLFGFASAISVLIFLIVGVVSVVSFLRTRRLEEMA